LPYNLANFLRSLVLPDQVAQWTLTTLGEKLVKSGARTVRHGRRKSSSPRSCAGSTARDGGLTAADHGTAEAEGRTMCRRLEEPAGTTR
jgi:hypothetical protein